MTALERQNFRQQHGLEECVACGGSGVSSRGKTCTPCKGTGAQGGGKAIAQHSSESAEHYTPIEIVEAARGVLGGIDLDPASCTLANEVIKAAAFYGPGGLAPDGLAEPWLGRVFLNPPGGLVPPEYTGAGTRSNAALWWATLAEAWRTGEVEAAIFVGFTLEILRSAQALDVPQPLDFPLCVPKSRIAFDTVIIGADMKKDGVQGFYSDGPKRIASSSPTHANVIVYLPPCSVAERDDVRAFMRQVGVGSPFREAFEPIGRCRT